MTAIRSAPDFLPGMGVLIDAFGTDYAPSTAEAGKRPPRRSSGRSCPAPVWR